MRCEKCKIRVPKNRPILVCSICRESKHYKCNNLSRSEAVAIVTNNQMCYWTCQDCITSLFPANIDNQTKSTDDATTALATTKYITYCAACNKPCSSGTCDETHNTYTCTWCDMPCHKKCLKNTLGCLACCNSIIPGYNYECYQLTNSLLSNNNYVAFAPYDNNSLINQIGNRLDTDEEGPVWAEIAEQMKKCKYIETKNIKMSNNNELKIMSLNIRSLTKNIDYIRENIYIFEKFDILSFCETNCNVDTLPNGFDDLTIDGFYSPFIQKPRRHSNLGGGWFSSYTMECVKKLIWIYQISILTLYQTPLLPRVNTFS